MKKDKTCPICGGLLAYCFDEWGHTPLHLHCLDYNIDIGSTRHEDNIRLLKENHVKDTFIEYWSNTIQEHLVEDTVIVDKRHLFDDK